MCPFNTAAWTVLPLSSRTGRRDDLTGEGDAGIGPFGLIGRLIVPASGAICASKVLTAHRDGEQSSNLADRCVTWDAAMGEKAAQRRAKPVADHEAIG